MTNDEQYNAAVQTFLLEAEALTQEQIVLTRGADLHRDPELRFGHG